MTARVPQRSQTAMTAPLPRRLAPRSAAGRRGAGLLLLLAGLALLGSGHGEAKKAAGTADAPGREQEAPPRDGDEALARLLAGNARYAEGHPSRPHEGMHRRALLVGGQHPYAAVLGCADSRVPPELVFDAGLGDLFVIRVAGNVVADDEAGSIEYAVDHLDVPLVLVLGHEGCGAVTAALGSTEGELPELSRLLARLAPALEDIDPELPASERVQRGVEANVRHAVEQLRAIEARESSSDAPALRIVGGVYELETGRVRLLD